MPSRQLSSVSFTNPFTIVADTRACAVTELADMPRGLCLLDEIEPGVDLCDSIGQLDRQPG